MNTRIFTAIAGAALAAGMLAASAPAVAAEAEQGIAIIEISDLDLTDSRQMRSLERRISSAARSICGTLPTRHLREVESISRCQGEVRATALSQAELAMGKDRSPIRVAMLSR